MLSSKEELSDKDAPVKKRQTKSSRSGLTLSAASITTYLKQQSPLAKQKLGRETRVALAASLEYIVNYVFEIAAAKCKELKKARILPRHISLAIASDADLSDLFARCYIPYGGSKLPSSYRILFKNMTADDDDSLGDNEDEADFEPTASSKNNFLEAGDDEDDDNEF